MPSATVTQKHEQATAATLSAIRLEGVSKRFEGGDNSVAALDRVRFEVSRGEIVGILGPSGCGKSTLLELVCGLLQPSDGSIEVHGCRSPTERADQCALMFQKDLLLPWRTAAANAALPLELQGVSKPEASERAREMLERFELADFADSPPHKLSGGMRQRVALARTLLTGRAVLLLDEPFASLDSMTRGRMQEWLALALSSRDSSALLVTHDVDEALYCCDRVLVFSNRPGRVKTMLEIPNFRDRPRIEALTCGDFLELRNLALRSLS